MSEINWEKLAEPFPSSDIEWRAAKCGLKKDGKGWAIVLAYVTNRAIMERLDAVIGPANWRNEYTTGPDGGVLCGISIRVGDGEWITKWDGAPNTQIESVKGGLSGAMKRAAVQWGIGRYLYNLTENFADVVQKNGPNVHSSMTKEKKVVLWVPPKLPKWALPKGQSDTGAARLIDLEDDAPPAQVVDNGSDKPASKPAQEKPAAETLVANAEVQSAWVDQIEQVPSFEQLVALEQVITAKSTVIEDANRLQLFRLICMRAKTIMPKGDKQAQQKMLTRIQDHYAKRFDWMPEDQANSLVEILRSHWS